MPPASGEGSAIPEFEADYIAANSAPDVQIYREEVHSQEPMKSVLENESKRCSMCMIRGNRVDIEPLGIQ